MSTPEALGAQAALLLNEVQRQENSLPVRLRALGMLTYTLDRPFLAAPLEGRLRATALLSPNDPLHLLAQQTVTLLDRAAATLFSDLAPALERHGYRLLSPNACRPDQRAWLADHFRQRVLPLLIPLAVDSGHPFPQVSSGSLNLLAVLQQSDAFDYETPFLARLKVPRRVPRLVELPPAAPPARDFILSEDMVRAHAHTLFPGMNVVGLYQFRLLRAAPEGAEHARGRDVALARQKHWPVARLDVEDDAPEWAIHWLQEQLEAGDAFVVRRRPPLGIGSMALAWAERLAHAAEEYNGLRV
jgi:polyphosphate kinase